MTPESFLPGFSEALMGAGLDDTREFDLTVPGGLRPEGNGREKDSLRGDRQGVESKKLPEADDAFASTIVEGKTFAEVRELAKAELGREKKGHIETQKREQVMHFLVNKVECELPHQYVVGETRRILADIVQQEQARGVTDEALKEGEKELGGDGGARREGQAQRQLHPPADRRGGKVTVSAAEVRARIAAVAARYGMTPEKAAKEIEKRNAMDRMAEEILSNKVIDFLVANADVRVAEEAAKPAVTGTGLMRRMGLMGVERRNRACRIADAVYGHAPSITPMLSYRRPLLPPITRYVPIPTVVEKDRAGGGGRMTFTPGCSRTDHFSWGPPSTTTWLTS